MESGADFLIQFGNQLKYLRKKKKLSYRKMAQRCNIDYSDISKIEKGRVNIQITTTVELAKGLGIQPKELFNFEFNIKEE